jgi:predicted nuclease of predicted toxin-antitoxin system
MRLIVDMNMSTKWVAALREAGFDTRHWSEVGDQSSPDRRIMEYAAANGAIVLTRDMDFIAILAANRMQGPSVVHLRDTDRFEPAAVRRVAMVLRSFDAELGLGAIVSMAGGRARVRRLPVRRDAPEESP